MLLLAGSKPKKTKRKKNAKPKTNGALSNKDITQAIDDSGAKEVDEDDQDTSPASEPQSPFPAEVSKSAAPNGIKISNNEQVMGHSEEPVEEESVGVQQEESRSKRNSVILPLEQTSDAQNASLASDVRLEALQKERQALREEVAQMRKNLEAIQERHDEELSNVREQLSQTEEEKESAEAQYQNLLGKVNTIRSQLGERLKADAVCSY